MLSKLLPYPQSHLHKLLLPPHKSLGTLTAVETYAAYNFPQSFKNGPIVMFLKLDDFVSQLSAQPQTPSGPKATIPSYLVSLPSTYDNSCSVSKGYHFAIVNRFHTHRIRYLTILKSDHKGSTFWSKFTRWIVW